MKNRLMFAAPAFVLAATLFAAPAANANFFEYTGRVTVAPISGIAAPVVNNGTSNVVLNTTGGDAITINALNSSGAFHENGRPPGTDIVFGDIGVSVGPNSPAQNISFGFTYSLTFTNYNVPAGGTPTGTGNINVTGILSGSIGAGRAVNLDNIQSYATVPANGQFTVGGLPYILTLNPFTPPGASNNGRFGANVVCVPEPASMVSMALGLVGMAGLAVRRNRRKAVTA